MSTTCYTGMRQCSIRIMFNNRSCITQISLHDSYFVEGSAFFDQDVELVWTGKLIVEISLGDQLQQGGPSAATLHGLAGLFEAR